jgi:hypothetical protein
MVQWGKVWGLVFFQSPKSGLTSLTILHPSQGHMVTLGGKNGPFPYVGSDMPFPAGIRITRMMKNDSTYPINIAFHFCGLIRPFRAPGRYTWVAIATLCALRLQSGPPPRGCRAQRVRIATGRLPIRSSSCGYLYICCFLKILSRRSICSC